ncbi:MAG: MBL fold metallo-hydrolase [Lachnospiraceae bacterium]|nr:MBL fold metallo-hydrolase [Lachnospiraceae bacterium]
MISEPWKGYMPPCRIFGNLYFVGTEPASTHIIDTGEGLIMIDSGYQQSLYLMLHNMHLMGLDPMDLKYIVHTHGHIDHMGATRALIEMTGAKTFLGEPDKRHVTGETDLHFANELGMTFTETFTPDVLLHDGDVIALGDTKILCLATPGHTPGAMSFFFDVSEGEETYRCGLHGGMGVNSMTKAYLTSKGLPLSLQEDFLNAMDRLAEEKVDIYLGNHVMFNNTKGKYRRLIAGDRLAFVNPAEWGNSCRWAKNNMMNVMKNET